MPRVAGDQYGCRNEPHRGGPRAAPAQLDDGAGQRGLLRELTVGHQRVDDPGGMAQGVPTPEVRRKGCGRRRDERQRGQQGDIAGRLAVAAGG